MDNKEEYYRYMDAQVALMTEEKKEALVNAIKMIFRTFVEDDTQGVLLLLDKDNCLTTMGLNATYGESERLIAAAARLFFEASMEMDNGEMKH